MNIEKRGNGWRLTKQVNKIRYRIMVDHKPTQREAEDLMQEYIQSQCGSVPEAHNLTFLEAGNAYVKLKNNILSPNTIIGYKKVIKHLPQWFNNKRIDNLTTLDIQKVINDMASDHSPKTIRNYHGFISAVLGTYRPNMRLKTTLPLKRKFEPYTPIDSDIKKILDEVAGSKYDIPFHLAVFGMRRGEICAVQSSDLSGNWLSINKSLAENPDGGWIVKPIPKTSESIRKIYLDDETAAKIRKVDGPLYDGKPGMLTKKLHMVQNKLGLPSFRLHDFRAYYVTMAHKIGIPDKYIMKNCGFSSSVVMERAYKRTQDDAMKKYNMMYAAKIVSKKKLPKNSPRRNRHPVK